MYTGDLSAAQKTKLCDLLPAKLWNVDVLAEELQRMHVHISINKLERMRGGSKFLFAVRDIFAPLLKFGGGAYEVMSLELVASSKGNTHPYHQDMRTGSATFSRGVTDDVIDDGKGGAPHGLRFLVDLGSDVVGHPARTMRYVCSEKGVGKNKINEGGGTEVHSSTHSIIAMNYGAAGHSGKGSVFHGRLGVGVTLTFDAILAQEEGGGRKVLKGLSKVDNAVRRNFHRTAFFKMYGVHSEQSTRITGGLGAEKMSRADILEATRNAMTLADYLLYDEDGEDGDQNACFASELLDLSAIYLLVREEAELSMRSFDVDYSDKVINLQVDKILKGVDAELGKIQHCRNCLAHLAGQDKSYASWQRLNFAGSEVESGELGTRSGKVDAGDGGQALFKSGGGCVDEGDEIAEQGEGRGGASSSSGSATKGGAMSNSEPDSGEESLSGDETAPVTCGGSWRICLNCKANRQYQIKMKQAFEVPECAIMNCGRCLWVEKIVATKVGGDISRSAAAIKRPRGNNPAGQEWDYLNGGWVDENKTAEETPKKKGGGSSSRPTHLFPRPKGRSSKNKVWDYSNGGWIDTPAVDDDVEDEGIAGARGSGGVDDGGEVECGSGSD